MKIFFMILAVQKNVKNIVCYLSTEMKIFFMILAVQYKSNCAVYFGSCCVYGLV